MKAQLDRFDSVLNEYINERGANDGHTDGVCFLETVNYESGSLKGHLEAMIAHIEHDQTHRQGQAVHQGDQRTIMRLTYDEDDNEHVQTQPQAQAVDQGGQRNIRRLTYDEDDNEPVLGPPTPVQDSLYSSGDIAGM